MPDAIKSIWQSNLYTLAVLCRAIESNDTQLVFICLTNLASKSRRECNLSAFAVLLETAQLSEERITQCLTIATKLESVAGAVPQRKIARQEATLEAINQLLNQPNPPNPSSDTKSS